MLSRRFIRIKVFKTLFSRVHSQSVDVVSAYSELDNSCEKTRQLYFLLLSYFPSLVQYASERIEIGRQKYQPTEEEKSPNLYFVQNKVIQMLAADEELNRQIANGKGFSAERSFLKKAYEQLKEQPYFQQYMNAPTPPDFAADLNLVKDMVASEFDDNPDLYSFLEDSSLYWVDDVAYVCNIILSVLDKVTPRTTVLDHPSLYKNEDDADFAHRLLQCSLQHYDQYVAYIQKFAANWELERIAATDTALVVMGLAEAVAFPGIPIKVTMNETVELSKFYSTHNSWLFVNGLLDKIIKSMMEEGLIVKQGRGLIDK